MSAVQPLALVFPQLELKHILVTTDFSDCSRSALKHAAAIARLHGSDIVVLHIVAPEPIFYETLEPPILEREKVSIKAREEMALAEQDTFSDVRHQFIVETGSLGSVLQDTIDQREISMLVLGTHGRAGIRKIFMGSTAEQMFRLADCPVMTVGPDVEPILLTHGRFQSILFATDFTSGSQNALAFAVGFAQESHARLTLLHVIEEGSVTAMYLHEQLKNNAQERLKSMVPASVGFPLETKVASGYPVEEILRIARANEADLIVLGVHKASRFGARTSAHLPWTIASTVVGHAKCPVLTVRG